MKEKLYVNIRLFGSLTRTKQHNSIAIELANHGFFTSAVFFPVVAQGKAATRIKLRVDMETTLIRHFCELISEFLRTHGRDIGS